MESLYFSFKCPYCNFRYRMRRPKKTRSFYCSQCFKMFMLLMNDDDCKIYPIDKP